MIPRITTSAAAALLLAFALVACASPAPQTSAKPTKPAVVETPKASSPPVETEEPEEPAAAPTCDTIISEGTVKALTDHGWTSESKEFVIGSSPMQDGILCYWADYTVASDHGQFFGWSAIDQDAAAKAQSDLLAEGWLREDAADGVYVTEDPDFALDVDDDGYGMTYLFGDGWVKFADTKQSLILIEWP